MLIRLSSISLVFEFTNCMVESLKSSEVNAARLVEKVKAGYKKVDDEMKNEKKMEEFYHTLFVDGFEEQLLKRQEKLEKYKTDEQNQFFSSRESDSNFWLFNDFT